MTNGKLADECERVTGHRFRAGPFGASFGFIRVARGNLSCDDEYLALFNGPYSSIVCGTGPCIQSALLDLASALAPLGHGVALATKDLNRMYGHISN